MVPRTRGAKDPDDRFILHAAFLLGCQFVSNDNYSEWHERFLNEGEDEMAQWLSRNEWNLRVAFVFLAAPRGTLTRPLTSAPTLTRTRTRTPTPTPTLTLTLTLNLTLTLTRHPALPTQQAPAPAAAAPAAYSERQCTHARTLAIRGGP